MPIKHPSYSKRTAMSIYNESYRLAKLVADKKGMSRVAYVSLLILADAKRSTTVVIDDTDRSIVDAIMRTEKENAARKIMLSSKRRISGIKGGGRPPKPLNIREYNGIDNEC